MAVSVVGLLCLSEPDRKPLFLRYLTSLLQDAVASGEAAEEFCSCFRAFVKPEDKRLLLASKVRAVHALVWRRFSSLYLSSRRVACGGGCGCALNFPMLCTRASSVFCCASFGMSHADWQAWRDLLETPQRDSPSSSSRTPLLPSWRWTLFSPNFGSRLQVETLWMDCWVVS